MKSLALLLLLATADTSRVVHFSMGGDIVVDRAPGGASLRTMGGDIRVHSSGDTVVAKTMGGRIRADQVAGSIDAGTMGGDVEVEVVGGGAGRSIDLYSMGGSIELTIPKSFAARFDVELEDGDGGRRDSRIVSDIPLHVEEEHHRHWFHDVRTQTATGTNGSGVNRVKIRTIGGDITIRSR